MTDRSGKLCSGSQCSTLKKERDEKMYEWEMTEHERIEIARAEFRCYGLYIFETFEEYMQNKEENEE